MFRSLKLPGRSRDSLDPTPFVINIDNFAMGEEKDTPGDLGDLIIKLALLQSITERRNTPATFLFDFLRQTSTSRTLTPEEKLDDAAYQGDITRIGELLQQYPHLSVNTPDPKDGRTLAHKVAACPCPMHEKLLQSLEQDFKADMLVQDKEGFNVYELAANPHKSHPLVYIDSGLKKEREDQPQYFMSELNARYAAREFPASRGVEMDDTTAGKLGVSHKIRLELVNNTVDMVNFIQQHPEYKQIGFIVYPPNAVRRDGHSSAILYDQPTRSLVQLDTLARLYLVPYMPGYTFYYNPFRLQRSSIGCAEASILLLHEIMTNYPEFISFCQTHSENTPDVLRPLTTAEKSELQSLQDESNFSLEKEFKASELMRKDRAETQLKVLNKMNIRVMDQIKQIIEWPIKLLPFCERYNAVRAFRTKDLLGDKDNQHILKRLMEKGQIRDKEKFIQTSILNPSKDADIAGRNYEERHKAYEVIRASRYTTVRRLFQTKLATVDEKTQMDPNKTHQQNEKNKAIIADTIASFATGLPRQCF